MNNKKEYIRMIVTLVAIAVVVALLLAGVNMLTKDKIAQEQAKKLNNSLKIVMPAGKTFEEVTDDTKDYDLFQAKNEKGEVVGYCVLNIGVGYGGDIQILTGVDTLGKITGVDILSHGETPGLGAKSDEAAFKDQFKEKSAGTVSVVKSGAKDNQIQAITGATITSKAVTEAVNLAKTYIEEGTK